MQIHDQQFEIFITEKQIQQRILELARQINHDYADKKPLFLAILNGSFMFMADVFRELTIDAEISFLKLKSYRNMESSGKIRELIGLEHNIFNRNIIIVEDIVDTGRTLHHILSEFQELGPKSVEILTLLYKPLANKVPVSLRYVGFEIPNDFIVGYGLDYDGSGRNLRDIYKIVNS